MFCPSCGTQNDDSARFCRNCGAALTAPPQSPTPSSDTMRGVAPARPADSAVTATGKNPTVAVILSILIVGVGQFYNADWKKGLVMLLGASILALPTSGIGWLAVLIWSAIDAYQVAKGQGKKW